MELRTKKLTLAELELADLDEIHTLHTMPETDRYNTLGIPGSLDVTHELLSGWLVQKAAIPRSTYVLKIVLYPKNQFVGLIALVAGKPGFRSAEVWYKILPQFYNRGLTTEALTTVLEFAFTVLALHRVEAGCAVENLASVKVLEKVGMTREGRKREVLPIRGEWMDNYFYAILESDFATLKCL